MSISFVNAPPDKVRIWNCPKLACVAVALLITGLVAQAQGNGRGQAAQSPATAPPAVQQVARNPVVDKAAEEQGKALWAANCITCHGTQARGSDSAPNLIRSEIVNYDRGAAVAGSALGPFLKKGHPTQSGRQSESFSDAEISALANFLREQVNETMRGSPTYIVLPQNLLTGDPKAGETDFTEFGCTKCHNDTTRSLSGIASRVTNPQTLQAMVVYPVAGAGRGGRGRGGRGGDAAPVTEPTGPKPPDPMGITVKITPASGAAISGWLVDQDAYFLTYSDAAGVHYTIRKTPGMKIETTNPLQWHTDFADRITNDQMHDLTAYLWSLK
jgi:mono/diheme cytochrome c family protein